MTRAVAARAGRREWVGLALPTLLLALDVSVLYLALPRLAASLEPSSTQLLWITDVYGFMLSGFLVTMGTLGDRIGRRRLLLGGAALFGAASVLAAYSSSPGMLIATRAALGVAGATLAPSTLALISNMFADPGQRARAIAVWVSCFMAGAVIGPLAGGLLLQHFWWGSAFLLGVPVMVVLLACGPLLPEHRSPAAARPDPASVALSLATLLPVVYGLKQLARDGWQPSAALAIAAGAAVGLGFVRRQRRLADPLLDLRLLGNRAFAAALGIGLFVGVIMGGVYLFVTQDLQLVAGLSPLRAGLWLLGPAVLLIALSLLAPGLARRLGVGTVIAGGLAVTAVGLLVLTRAGAGAGGLGLVVGGYAVISLGVGAIGVLGIDLVVGAAPPERAGSASALSETSGELGLALGVALLGSLGTAVYRGQLAAHLPAGVPAAAAAAARDTLAGADASAGQLPAQLGVALLGAARGAFTSGLHAVAATSAIIAAVYAAVVMVVFRPASPARDAGHDP